MTYLFLPFELLTMNEENKLKYTLGRKTQLFKGMMHEQEDSVLTFDLVIYFLDAFGRVLIY